MTHQQRGRTVQETRTPWPPADVLGAAKRFFSGGHGVYAAFVEAEGPTHVTLRGQGGQEIVVAAVAAGDATRVTASSYLFDQQVARFLASLPAAG